MFHCNSRPFSQWGFLIALLFLFSCSTGMETGELYEVSTEQESGIFIPDMEEHGHCSGIFYMDCGNLYAEKIQVVVNAGPKKLTMVFPGGEKKEVSVEAYQKPEYKDLPEVRLYTKPAYKVKESLDEHYGQGRGFWSSYPCAHGENFAITFGRKTAELFSMKDDVDLTMDVYTPVGDKRNPPRPLFLMIHGGAFFNGDKRDEEFVEWCRYFASLGYVAASINYRLGFRPTHNEIQRAGYRAVQDANAAIRYLINQKELNINPELVFVSGTSAGAITALNVAFMSDDDRPAITKGGRLGDEGRIDAINPEVAGSFEVRAVGNMWGAVYDLKMLGNQSTPVISFHGEGDPIVPYRSGYPFQQMLLDAIDDFGSWFDEDGVIHGLLGSINPNRLLFDQMYGSYGIDRELRRNNVNTEIHAFPIDKHSLHLDEDGGMNERFNLIQDGLTAFFSSEMESRPVSIAKDDADPQLISINPTHVKHCYWSIEGGVFRSISDNKARVLLFPDAPNTSVTIQGDYDSSMTFKETIEL
jgi:poly(3-hydroxybutyrate) depolymerase